MAAGGRASWCGRGPLLGRGAHLLSTAVCGGGRSSSATAGAPSRPDPAVVQPPVPCPPPRRRTSPAVHPLRRLPPRHHPAARPRGGSLSSGPTCCLLHRIRAAPEKAAALASPTPRQCLLLFRHVCGSTVTNLAPATVPCPRSAALRLGRPYCAGVGPPPQIHIGDSRKRPGHTPFRKEKKKLLIRFGVYGAL